MKLAKKISEEGNVTHEDALVLIAFNQNFEVVEALHNQQIWALLEKTKERLRCYLEKADDTAADVAIGPDSVP